MNSGDLKKAVYSAYRRWSFDAAGRVIQQMASIDGIEYPLGYSYMESGCGCSQKSLRSITYPDATMVNYGRDDIERITSIYSDIYHPFAEYSYDSEIGAVSDISTGDSVDEHYIYDNIGRMTEQHMYNGANYSKWFYSYSPSSLVSQIKQEIHQGASTDTSRFEYVYDRLQRLTSATHSVSPSPGVWSPPDQINSFTYDQFGNMLTNQLQFPNDPGLDSQTTFDVNAANNRLNSYANNQGPVSTLYDPAGNMVMEGSRTYTYDGANRISKVGSDSGVYRYDALGRRVVKTYEVGDGTNVPADYDGDGISDVAVWRPDTAHWFIRSSLSPETMTDIEWGALGSKAVPADYDGDGIADVAVWMPDTGL